MYCTPLFFKTADPHDGRKLRSWWAPKGWHIQDVMVRCRTGGSFKKIIIMTFIRWGREGWLEFAYNVGEMRAVHYKSAAEIAQDLIGLFAEIEVCSLTHGLHFLPGTRSALPSNMKQLFNQDRWRRSKRLISQTVLSSYDTSIINKWTKFVFFAQMIHMLHTFIQHIDSKIKVCLEQCRTTLRSVIWKWS